MPCYRAEFLCYFSIIHISSVFSFPFYYEVFITDLHTIFLSSLSYAKLLLALKMRNTRSLIYLQCLIPLLICLPNKAQILCPSIDRTPIMTFPNHMLYPGHPGLLVVPCFILSPGSGLHLPGLISSLHLNIVQRGAFFVLDTHIY